MSWSLIFGDGVEVAVQRDSADAHHGCHVLDRTAKEERALLVETTNGDLFLGAVHVGEGGTDVQLDDVDESVECAVQLGPADVADGLAVPFDWEITRPVRTLWYDGGTEVFGDPTHDPQQPFGFVGSFHTVDSNQSGEMSRGLTHLDIL